jgi:hypothetical protein
MRLTLACAFGAGYVLGTKAGRARYDQLRAAAQDTAGRIGESGLRDRLGDYGGRLEAYAQRARQSQAAR